MSDTATNKYELNEYVLGSGHLHFEELETRPTDWLSFMKTFFASQTNLLGRIKGGASLEYTTEKTEDQDDLGFVVLEELKSEKVILKSGMMTWNGETIAAVCATARVSSPDENGIVNYANNTFYAKLIAGLTPTTDTTPQSTYNPIPKCNSCCNN